MPCYDPRDSASYVEDHELKPLRKKLERVEAMLCGVLTALEGPVGMYINGELMSMVLNHLDYEEMGLTRADIDQWFDQHKTQDKLRRVREAKEQRRLRARKLGQLSALANELGVTLPKGLK